MVFSGESEEMVFSSTDNPKHFQQLADGVELPLISRGIWEVRFYTNISVRPAGPQGTPGLRRNFTRINGISQKKSHLILFIKITKIIEKRLQFVFNIPFFYSSQSLCKLNKFNWFVGAKNWQIHLKLPAIKTRNDGRYMFMICFYMKTIKTHQPSWIRMEFTPNPRTVAKPNHHNW